MDKKFSNRLNNKEGQDNNWGTAKMLSLFSRFEEELGQLEKNSFTNLSNKNKLEQDEIQVVEFNQRNKELLEKMGVQLYLYRFIMYEDKSLHLLGLGEKVHGDLNAINHYGLRLIDGNKFSQFIKETSQKLDEVRPSEEESRKRFRDIGKIKDEDFHEYANKYVQVQDDFDKIFRFIQDQIFKEFDFLEQDEVAVDPTDSFFEFLKQGEAIIRAYQSIDAGRAERLLITLDSIKKHYYKEYLEYKDVFFGYYDHVKNKTNEYKNPEVAMLLDKIFNDENEFKKHWNDDINQMIFIEGFGILEKISENAESINGEFLLKELSYYPKIAQKSIEAAKRFKSQDIIKTTELFLQRYDDLITKIINKYKGELSPEKIIQAESLLVH